MSLTASELERELKAVHRLAYRLMPPLNRRPHLFHESKAELIEAVARLIDRVRGVAPPVCAFTAPQRDAGARQIARNGRVIPIERR